MKTPFFEQIQEIKDSYNFLNASLFTLTENLKTKMRPFCCIYCNQNVSNTCDQCNKKESPEKIFFHTFHYLKQKKWDKYANKILRKNIYPYDYIISESVLKETKFPPKAAFFDCLREKTISDDDYALGKDIWDTLKMSTLAEYAELYAVMDITLLGDIFQGW